MSLGEKIKQLRTEYKLTQEEFAEKLFVSRTAVSKWETNRGYPSLDILKQIAIMFNTTVDNLLSEDDIKNKQLLDKSSYKSNNTICFMGLGVSIVSLISLIFISNPLFIGIICGLAVLGICFYIVFTELSLGYYKDKQITKKQATINKFRRFSAAFLLFIVIDVFIFKLKI